MERQLAVQQLLTCTAVTFLAVVLRFINIVLHPLYRVAVDHRDIVLVCDVNYLVDVQHHTVQQGADCSLNVVPGSSTCLQVRQTDDNNNDHNYCNIFNAGECQAEEPEEPLFWTCKIITVVINRRTLSRHDVKQYRLLANK